MPTNTETKSPEITPPDLWRGAFLYLTNVADRRLSAEDYAMEVRKLYDVLAEDTGDAERALEFLKRRVPEQHGSGLISKQHQNLALNCCPSLPAESAVGLKVPVASRPTKSGGSCTGTGFTKRASIRP